MTSPLAFLLAAITLLAAPGPTNALLATGGFGAGARGAWRLVAAVLAGYSASIALFVGVIGPLTRSSHALAFGLRAACAAWLVFLAVSLWRGPRAGVTAGAVTPGKMFVTTLLNPKGMVLAFAVLPHLAQGHVGEAAPYCAALACVIVAVSSAWAGLGTALQARVSERVVRRVSACVLVLSAVLLVGVR